MTRTMIFDDEEPITPRQHREEAARARTPRKPPPEPIVSARTRRQEQRFKEAQDAREGA